MKYTYKPRGTCSQLMVFDMDGNIINGLEVMGGCNGNLKGIAALVRGMNAEDAIARMEGIRCGMKPTSCPDQIAQGLKKYLSENAG